MPVFFVLEIYEYPTCCDKCIRKVTKGEQSPTCSILYFDTKKERDIVIDSIDSYRRTKHEDIEMLELEINSEERPKDKIPELPGYGSTYWFDIVYGYGKIKDILEYIKW